MVRSWLSDYNTPLNSHPTGANWLQRYASADTGYKRVWLVLWGKGVIAATVTEQAGSIKRAGKAMAGFEWRLRSRYV